MDRRHLEALDLLERAAAALKQGHPVLAHNRAREAVALLDPDAKRPVTQYRNPHERTIDGGPNDGL